jgi:predicted nucleotidyltransferase
MPKTLPNASDMIMLSVIQKSLKELKNLPDCSEGLENRIYKMVRQSSSLEELLEKTLCKRYTKTRLQRILICSLLGINKKLVALAKKTTPYIKVLAIKKDKMHILSEIAKSATLITRSGDEQKLNKKQQSLFKTDKFAGEIYSLITGAIQKPFEMKII